VGPINHPRHVFLVQRHQEWHKVRGIALVHLVEHLVEILDHLAERNVAEGEATRAKVLEEDVRARVHDQRFGVKGFAGNAVEVIDQ